SETQTRHDDGTYDFELQTTTFDGQGGVQSSDSKQSTVYHKDTAPFTKADGTTVTQVTNSETIDNLSTGSDATLGTSSQWHYQAWPVTVTQNGQQVSLSGTWTNDGSWTDA